MELCPATNRCGRGFVWSGSYRPELLDLMRTRGAYVELHLKRAPRSDVLRGKIVLE